MRSIWESLRHIFETEDKPKSSKDKEPDGGSLPGRSHVKGAPDIEPEQLPKAVQGAPGTSTGIGAGRIAAKNAEPTSVSLGAKARRVDPGASGIKSRFNVSPDAFFSDAPVKMDPKTGKAFPLQGRPGKDQPDTVIQHEPFAAKHSAAMAKNAAKTPVDKSKIKQYDAGAWGQAAGHLPKGGEVRNKDGNSTLTNIGGERTGDFHGQQFKPAGFTAPDDEDWETNPELAARRLGGTKGKKMQFAQQNIGQKGRAAMAATPGKAPGKVFNKYAGEWQDQETFDAAQGDLRSKIAAKMAMRGADIANQKSAGKVPWRAAAAAPGATLDKSANAQKSQARADAIASKPLAVNIRRDPEERPKSPAPAPSERPPEAQAAAPQGVDRTKLKQMIAQRLAAAAAKKAGTDK